MKNCLFLILVIVALSSCSDDVKGYFKKSANNKLIDSQGFKGGKRAPLYNKKYVNLAKRNIVESNFDEDDDVDFDDDYELENPSRTNRQMYMQMLKKEALEREKRAKRKRSFIEDDCEGDYPSLAKATKATGKDNEKIEALQKELTEIKAMLNEAKKNLEKYKCPTVSEQAAKPVKKPDNTGKSSAKNYTEQHEEPQSKTKFMQEQDDFEPQVAAPNSI